MLFLSDFNCQKPFDAFCISRSEEDPRKPSGQLSRILRLSQIYPTVFDTHLHHKTAGKDHDEQIQTQECNFSSPSGCFC